MDDLGQVDISYEQLPAYEVAPDLQRKLDEAQEQLVNQLIIPQLLGGNQKVEPLVEIVGPLVDDFQYAVESMVVDPTVSKKYLEDLHNELDSLAKGLLGRDYVTFKENAEAIVDGFLIEYEFAQILDDVQSQNRILGGSAREVQIDAFFKDESAERVETAEKYTEYLMASILIGADTLRVEFPDLYGALLEVQMRNPVDLREFAASLGSEVAYAEGVVADSRGGKDNLDSLANLVERLEQKYDEIRYEIDLDCEEARILDKEGVFSLRARYARAVISQQLYKVKSEMARLTLLNAFRDYDDGQNLKQFKKELSIAQIVLEESQKERGRAYNALRPSYNDDVVEMSQSALTGSEPISYSDEVYQLSVVLDLVKELIGKVSDIVEYRSQSGNYTVFDEMDEAFSAGSSLLKKIELTDKERQLLKEYGVTIPQLTDSTSGDDMESVRSNFEEVSKALALVAEALKKEGEESEAKIAEVQATIEDLELELSQIELSTKTSSLRDEFEGVDLIDAKRRDASLGGFQENPSFEVKGGRVTLKEDVKTELLYTNLIGFTSFLVVEQVDFIFKPSVVENNVPMHATLDYSTQNGRGAKYLPEDLYQLEGGDGKVDAYLLGKSKESVVRLPVPSGYKVDDKAVKLNMDIRFDVRIDEAGFTYLLVDNPSNDEIYYSVGIEQGDLYTSHVPPLDRLSEKLYTGDYSPEAQAMMAEVQANPDLYSSADAIVERVYRFIQENYVYTLDAKYNSSIVGPHLVGAIEGAYIDVDGEKKHPSICNVTAYMAVAYLRELGVPAMSVDGIAYSMDSTAGKGIGHAWVRYYDEGSSKFKEFDPTATRIIGELRRVGDAMNEEDMTAIYRAREIELEKKLLVEKQAAIQEDLLSLQFLTFKFEKESGMRTNDNFSPMVLEQELMAKFQDWKSVRDDLLASYFKAEGEEQVNAEKKLKHFVQETIKQARLAVLKMSNSTVNNPAFTLVYIEFYLAMVEHALKINPLINVDDMPGLLEDFYAQIGEVKRFYKSIVKLSDGREVIDFDGSLYERRKNQGYTSFKKLDLDFEEHDIRYFQKVTASKDGSHWVAVAQRSESSPLIIKDGVIAHEMPETSYAIDVQVLNNGDVVVADSHNEGEYADIYYNFQPLGFTRPGNARMTDAGNHMLITTDKIINGIKNQNAESFVDDITTQQFYDEIDGLPKPASTGGGMQGSSTIAGDSMYIMVNTMDGSKYFNYDLNEEKLNQIPESEYQKAAVSSVETTVAKEKEKFELDGHSITFHSLSGRASDEEVRMVVDGRKLIVEGEQFPISFVLGESMLSGTTLFAFDYNRQLVNDIPSYLADEFSMWEDYTGVFGNGAIGMGGARYKTIDVVSGETYGWAEEVGDGIMMREQDGMVYLSVVEEVGGKRQVRDVGLYKEGAIDFFDKTSFAQGYMYDGDLYVLEVNDFSLDLTASTFSHKQEAQLRLVKFPNIQSHGSNHVAPTIVEERKLDSSVAQVIFQGGVLKETRVKTVGDEHYAEVYVDNTIYNVVEFVVDNNDGQYFEAYGIEDSIERREGVGLQQEKLGEEDFRERILALSDDEILGREQFVVEALKLQAQFENGEDLGAQDVRMLVENYAFYGASTEFFNYTAQGAGERLTAAFSFYRKRNDELSKKLDQTDMDKIELAFLETAIVTSELVDVSELDGLHTSEELGSFLDELMYSNYSLLLDDTMNINSRINGSMHVLRAAISKEHPDNSVIDRIVKSMKVSPARYLITKQIEAFALLPNPVALGVNPIWREVYWELVDEEKKTGY